MFQDEKSQKYTIPAFSGYKQSIDESLLNPGDTNNAQNCVVSNGSLEVTKGYTKYFDKAVPGGVKSLMSYFSHKTDGTTTKRILASSDTALYMWTGTSWSSIKTGLTSGEFGYVNYYKNLEDLLIITNGSDPVMKFNGLSVTNLGGTPPKGTSIGLHYQRIWMTGMKDNPDGVAYSGAMDPENWNLTENEGGVEQIHTWDGGKCEALSTIFDDVVVFKTYDAWKIVGTYPGEYQVVRLYSAVGSIAKRSIVDAGNVSFFLDRSGIYIYDGMQTHYISDDVKDIIANMNHSYASKATAAFNDNTYILAIPEGSSTKNNCIIEYNLLTKKFIIKRGFQVNTFLKFDNKLLFSNDTGYVYEYNSGDSFDGTPIVAYWDSPLTTLGSLDSTKRSTYIYCDLEQITGGMKATAIFDDIPKSVVIDKPLGKGIRLKGKGRKFRLRFENINGSRFILRTPELHVDVDAD